MSDQADELRQLVRRDSLRNRGEWVTPPHRIVVFGGKGGVGATTAAVSIAVLLAKHGHRTVLVDADLSSPDVAQMCQIDAHHSVADVLAGRHSVHEVLLRGPAGLQILPGAWAPEKVTECSSAALHKFIEEINGLGNHADVVVIDVGSGPSQLVRDFWRSADAILVVTTAESQSIVDTYAAIKILAGESPILPHTLVNRVDRSAEGQEVHLRIANASRRFLGIEPTSAGFLPNDPSLALLAENDPIPSTNNQDSRTQLCLERIVKTLLVVQKTHQTTPAAKQESPAA